MNKWAFRSKKGPFEKKNFNTTTQELRLKIIF